MDEVMRARALHDTVAPHYSCAQATMVALAGRVGMDEEMAYRATANYGSGMKCGAVCGAFSAGMMALGLAGADKEAVSQYRKAFQAEAGGLNCRELLQKAKEAGEPTAVHCDRMVTKSVAFVVEALEK